MKHFTFKVETVGLTRYNQTMMNLKCYCCGDPARSDGLCDPCYLAMSEEDPFAQDADYDDGSWDFEDNLTDVEADAMTLASAGWGTDEDYGYTGDDY